MGRIKTTFIKTFGRRLLEKYSNRFGTDFEQNKKFLDELDVTESKKIRNIIAGYLVHIMKRKESGQSLKISYLQKIRLRKKKPKKRRRR